MIPSIGNLALWSSFFFSVFQLIFTRTNKNIKYIGLIVNCLFFSSLISFFLLMYSHVVSDFSIINVFENSHTTKPLLYKIVGLWGNHEGSMLLWILVLTLFNYFIYKLINKENSSFILKTLEIQAFIIIGFLLFTILTSNPFLRIFPPKIEGLGFNPILQDPALAIHPPLLYLGYVGFSSVFFYEYRDFNLKPKAKYFLVQLYEAFCFSCLDFFNYGNNSWVNLGLL